MFSLQIGQEADIAKEYSRIPKTVLTLGSPKALGDVPAKTLAKRSTVTTGTAEADVYIWTASVSLLEPAIWR